MTTSTCESPCAPGAWASEVLVQLLSSFGFSAKTPGDVIFSDAAKVLLCETAVTVASTRDLSIPLLRDSTTARRIRCESRAATALINSSFKSRTGSCEVSCSGTCCGCCCFCCGCHLLCPVTSTRLDALELKLDLKLALQLTFVRIWPSPCRGGTSTEDSILTSSTQSGRCKTLLASCSCRLPSC